MSDELRNYFALVIEELETLDIDNLTKTKPSKRKWLIVEKDESLGEYVVSNLNDRHLMTFSDNEFHIKETLYKTISVIGSKGGFYKYFVIKDGIVSDMTDDIIKMSEL